MHDLIEHLPRNGIPGIPDRLICIFRLNVKSRLICIFFTPENLERLRHKASGAALGLSCVACFEQPAGVFAGCGAKYNPRVIASGTAMSLMGESSKSHLKVFSGFVLLMSLSCQRQATAKADICRCRSFGGDNIRTLT